MKIFAFLLALHGLLFIILGVDMAQGMKVSDPRAPMVVLSTIMGMLLIFFGIVTVTEDRL